jgi:tetratricopeptide (TPR) repeat protein
MNLHVEAGRICHELGNPVGFARSLGSQADILKDTGEFASAHTLYEQAESAFRGIPAPFDLAITLANHAELLAENGNIDEAISMADEASRMVSLHGYHSLTETIDQVLARVHATENRLR